MDQSLERMFFVALIYHPIPWRIPHHAEMIVHGGLEDFWAKLCHSFSCSSDQVLKPIDFPFPLF